MTAEQLLADAGWLRRLALRLAGDADADDLVQETWIAAWRRAPDGSRSLRPWLRKVMRDTLRMGRRSARRRVAREEAVASDGAAATPEELLAQVRLHQVLVEAVLALDEPFRSTVIQIYVEGRSAASIARSSGVPEGTVRWRLHEALRRLRAHLDAKHRGWAPAVLAFAGRGAGPASIILALAALLALLIGGLVVHAARGTSASASTVAAGPTTASAARSPAAARAPAPPIRVAPKPTVPATGAAPWWNVPGQQVHPIRGRVVDRGGAAIADAEVQLVGWSGVASTVQTGRDGTFAFAPRGTVMSSLVATAPGFAGHTVRVDPRGPANETVPGEVVIALDPCTATVEGTVADAEGGPIVGATVTASAGFPAWGPSTTTDARGHYETCIAVDASGLVFAADGYGHLRLPIRPRGHQRLDAALVPEARIIGRVVDAETRAPVANAQVNAGGPAGSPSPAFTGDDGTFELTGVPGGPVRIGVWSTDHAMVPPHDLTAVAGETIGPIEIAMPRGATVRGRVVSGGAPLAGASLQFYAPSPQGTVDSNRAVSGDDGSFVAMGVGLGDAVEVVVRGAVVHSPLTIDTRSGDVSDLVIDVDPPAAVHGIVSRHGAPIGGATVTIRSARGRTQTAETDARGRFAVTAPERGPCTATAQSDLAGAATSHPIEVSCDASTDLAIALDGGARISGIVVDDSGAPVAGVRVKAGRGDDTGAAVSGTDGAFAIDQLAGGGDYSITVAGGDPSPPVTLADGDAVRTGLRLTVRR